MISTYLEGAAVDSFLTCKFTNVSGKTIYLVKVERGYEPTYLLNGDKAEYFVRIRNSTKRFDAREAISHYKIRWCSKEPDAK